MGCDIHIATEVRKTIDNKEKWVCADHFQLNPYFGSEGESEYDVIDIYSGRNYDLFTVLANVRNYSDNEFIAEPKGAPEDASEQAKKRIGDLNGDGHSHSYFTLAELKTWRKEHLLVKRSGMISAEAAAKLDAGTEFPNSWCQATNIANYVYREWEEESCTLDCLIEAMDERMRDIFWVFDPEEERQDLDEKTRVVFWFDN